MDDEMIDKMVAEKVEEKVQAVMEKNNGMLLKELSSMISKISAPVSTNVNVLDAPKFKRKSNEEQFKINAKVLNKIEEAEGKLDVHNVEQARESLIQAKDLVKRRQKLIKLADASELGWRVVTEYETNPVASDSDDEKRIYKAEARATRKAKSDRSKRGRTRFGPYKRTSTSTETATAPLRQQTLQAARQRPGLCFQCGKPGHWKSECQQQTNNKISVCSQVCNCKCDQCICNVTLERGSIDGNGMLFEQYNDEIECKEAVSMSVCPEENKEMSGMSELSRSVGPEEPKVISPVGSLKSHISKWKDVSNNTYILDVIENGYKLPFRVVPDSARLRNNRSARVNPKFVSEEIESLLKKGVISKVEEPPHIINPLTVAYSRSGKPRLVLDCRHIHPCLHLFTIKFEDIKLAEEMLENSSYVFTFDLKSAYHHIDIYPSHRTFLGFCWVQDDTETFYVYNSLAFGIATAGHIFTKTTRVVVKYWRSLGHRVIMYLDDGIGGHRNYSYALTTSEFVKQSLAEFGFISAEDKCSWAPSPYATWLGHKLNFKVNRLFISDDRVKRLEVSLESCISQIQKDQYGSVPVRYLASIVGQIISLQSVFGKVVCRLTKYLYKCILTRACWNSLVQVTSNAMNELTFWRKNVVSMNARGKCKRRKKKKEKRRE